MRHFMLCHAAIADDYAMLPLVAIFVAAMFSLICFALLLLPCQLLGLLRVIFDAASAFCHYCLFFRHFSAMLRYAYLPRLFRRDVVFHMLAAAFCASHYDAMMPTHMPLARYHDIDAPPLRAIERHARRRLIHYLLLHVSCRRAVTDFRERHYFA